MQTDGQTDMMKQVEAFRNFAKAPKTDLSTTTGFMPYCELHIY